MAGRAIQKKSIELLARDDEGSSERRIYWGRDWYGVVSAPPV